MKIKILAILMCLFVFSNVKAEENAGTVSLSVDYANTENEKKAVLIAAEYDGDKLSEIHISKSMQIKSGFGTLDFFYEGKLNKEKTKLMIWDSVSGLHPVAPIMSVN